MPPRRLEVALVEVRQCPACRKTFKCSPDSKSIYDSRICANFDDYRIEEPMRTNQLLYEVEVPILKALGPGRKESKLPKKKRGPKSQRGWRNY